MSDRAKYSRVYWRVLDDEEFDAIRSNEARFGAWTLMLLAADMSWPTPAYIPPVVSRKSIEALVDAGLIELLSGGRFKLRGIDKERASRSESGRIGAGVRWHSERGADGMPRREETRRDEKSTDAPERWDAPETEALVWLSRHGCDIRPGNGYHRQLVTAVERHGANAIVGMFDRLARAGTKDGDTKGFLFAAIDSLNARSRPDLRSLETEERAGERTEAYQNRVKATKIRAHETGAHQAQPVEGCPRCEEDAA